MLDVLVSEIRGKRTMLTVLVSFCRFAMCEFCIPRNGFSIWPNAFFNAINIQRFNTKPIKNEDEMMEMLNFCTYIG